MRGLEPAPLQLRLQARPEYAPLLRERLRMWLEDAGADERAIFEVILATTEAFANAVEHPHEPRCHLVDVEAAITDDAVSVSIRDYGKWDGGQTRKEDGGLGLVMMEHLMDVVRVECFVDGTIVRMQRRLVDGNERNDQEQNASPSFRTTSTWNEYSDDPAPVLRAQEVEPDA